MCGLKNLELPCGNILKTVCFEPVRFTDILRVRWFLKYRKYAITGRVQTTTFLKGGASPPASDNHAAATEEDETEPGNVAFEIPTPELSNCNS